MEYVDHHYAQEEIFSLKLAIKAIFYVHGSADYQVNHGPLPGQHVLILTLSGEGQLETVHDNFVLQSGEYLIFDASTTFNYECTANHWHFWWFEFQLQPNSLNHLDTQTKVAVTVDDNLIFLCHETLNSLKLKNHMASSSFLSSLICLLQNRGNELKLTENNFAIFQKADEFFRQNLDSATIMTCALHLGVSETTLRETFNKLLKAGPGTYLKQLRIDMAKHLLSTSSLSVKEISDQLGYADQFSFSKSFKKETGFAPLKYRQTAFPQ